VFNNIGHVIDIDMLRETYQELDGNKAIGIDGVTKEVYGQRLEKNLANLLQQIRRGQYEPRPSKLVEIPKEDGTTRPLAVSCFEDKIVQSAVNKILSAIYEPLFIPCSFGFRPEKNCHDALRTLVQWTYKNSDGAIVEIDIRKYFNSIPLGPLTEFLRNKITDDRFLKLLNVLMSAPTLIDGTLVPNERGCPQGSILSPVLANIYLHYVIDTWFDTIKRSHVVGYAHEVRYADDMVFIFQHQKDAERFFKALPLRLNKFGLDMHLDKSSILPSGSIAAARANATGTKIPTYKFLGFTCYWGLARNGKFWRLKFTSRADRFSAKLEGLRKYLWENLTIPDTNYLLKRVAAVVRGWINYHGISDNERRVGSFILASKRALMRWFHRRGDRIKMNWKRLTICLRQVDFPERWKVTSMFPTPNKGVA
jgi:RNA-directed DNA polymerase